MIIIPPQQNSFKLFWVVGWVVAILPVSIQMIIQETNTSEIGQAVLGVLYATEVKN